MDSGAIVLLIIIILLGVALWFIAEDRDKWKDKYFKKVSYIFSTDYEIGKEINCIDYFYSIYENKVCKFKTTGLELELVKNEDDFPTYKISNVEGVCIEGHEDLIGDRITLGSDKIYLTKNSLIENL